MHSYTDILYEWLCQQKSVRTIDIIHYCKNEFYDDEYGYEAIAKLLVDEKIRVIKNKDDYLYTYTWEVVKNETA